MTTLRKAAEQARKALDDYGCVDSEPGDVLRDLADGLPSLREWRLSYIPQDGSRGQHRAWTAVLQSVARAGAAALDSALAEPEREEGVRWAAERVVREWGDCSCGSVACQDCGPGHARHALRAALSSSPAEPGGEALQPKWVMLSDYVRGRCPVGDPVAVRKVGFVAWVLILPLQAVPPIPGEPSHGE